MTSSIEKAIKRSENSIKEDQDLVHKVFDDKSDNFENRLSEPGTRHQCNVDVNQLEKMGFLVPGSDQQDEMADEYRVIKRPLLANAFGKGAAPIENANMIMVVSALPGEGKTHTVLNLGMSMAMEMDTTVLILDGDVIKPSLSRIFGLEDEPGLADLLLDKEMDIGDVIYSTDIPKLKILPAGNLYQNTTELLSGDEMNRVANELAGYYDDRIILIDAPPLLVTNQANILVQYAGQILLVVEEGKTSQEAVKESLLQIAEDKVIGMILNKSKRSSFGVYGGYYGGGYESRKAK